MAKIKHRSIDKKLLSPNKIDSDIEKDFLSQYKIDSVFDKQNKKDNSIDNSVLNQKINKDFLSFLYDGSEITRKYHFSIMEQAQGMLKMFSILFVVVTSVVLSIAVGFFVFIFIFKSSSTFTDYFPIFIGGIVDLFVAILIVVINKLLKSRDKFFKKNVESERFGKIMGLVFSIKEEKEREKLIKEVVRCYFKADNKNEENK